jgi:hypothetical protein
LSDAGWADSRTVRIETRWFSGDPERARRYATELHPVSTGHRL